MHKFDESIDELLFFGIRFMVSEIVGLEFSSELYDSGNVRETTPIKIIPQLWSCLSFVLGDFSIKLTSFTRFL